jgi:hypothetical protein
LEELFKDPSRTGNQDLDQGGADTVKNYLRCRIKLLPNI